MSEGNVELVRRALEAFNSGDMDAAVEIFHEDAVWIPYLGALEGRVYSGRDAILGLWRDLDENLGRSFKVELQELTDLGDQVVGLVRASGIGTGSGAEVSQTWAQLASIREGKVLRVEPFPDRERALAAARSRSGR